MQTQLASHPHFAILVDDSKRSHQFSLITEAAHGTGILIRFMLVQKYLKRSQGDSLLHSGGVLSIATRLAEYLGDIFGGWSGLVEA